MTIIKRSAIVAYSARQMFELVNSVEEYPRFLPWCSAARVINQTQQIVEAAVEISWSGVHKSFTTRNHLSPYERIDISLVEGPFRRFTGGWRFIELHEQGCKVDLELEFELAGYFFDKMFQPIFHRIANSLVDVFCKRAVEIYGTV